MAGNELVQSLTRGLDLLPLLARAEGGLRLVDLTAATGLKRPTVHNLLRTLVSREFVVQADSRYRLGPAIYELARVDASNDFLRQVEPVVQRLSERLPDAIVSFCQPVGCETVARFQLYPDRILVRRTEGAVYLPYQTASGLALLAYADPETRQQVQLRHPFEVEGLAIWQSTARLETFLKHVRGCGYVLPPFCAHSTYRLAAWPCLSADARLLGVVGVAWNVAPGAADDGTKGVLAALRDAARDVSTAPAAEAREKQAETAGAPLRRTRRAGKAAERKGNQS